MSDYPIPQAESAEKTLLAKLFDDGSGLNEVEKFGITEEMFFSPVCKAVFAAFKSFKKQTGEYAQPYDIQMHFHKFPNVLVDNSALEDIICRNTATPVTTLCSYIYDAWARREGMRITQEAFNNISNPSNATFDVIESLKKDFEKFNRNADTEDFQIDLSQIYPEPEYTVTIGGVGTMPRGDVQAIKAKSKNGKSYLCSVLIASILGCTEFGGEKRTDKPSILYFDTEQNQLNTARLARRVHTLMGWSAARNHEGFEAYSLRPMNTEKRTAFIEKMTREKTPTVIFIDGVADLIEDFNDVTQSQVLIAALMKLSTETNCAICCVLHTNKTKGDNAMKGHLGTLLLQKASDVFEVRKEDGLFNVKETDSRNIPIAGFSFAIDGHGIPFKGTHVESLNTGERNELKESIELVFKDRDNLTYSDLRSILAGMTGVSESTAARRIRDALSKGIIFYNSDSKVYHL